MAPAPAAMPFSLTVFAGSLVWISLSYSGFNAAVYVAGEAKDAQRNAPKALIVGTLIVTVLYIALNAAFVYLPPFQTVVGQEAVAAAAAQAIGGTPAALAIRFVTVLALITSVFSLVMAGPRVYARMAYDGVFPSFFRFGGAGAPTAAITAQAALAILLIVVSDLRGLLSYLGFLAGAAVMIERIRRRDQTLGLALGAVLLALVVHSLAYSGFFEDPVTWVVVAVACAAWVPYSTAADA